MGHRKNNRKGRSADRHPETPTLGTLFDWYEKAVLQHRRLQTQHGFRSTFRQALLRFGPQATPTASEVQGWLSERIERERLAPATANLLRDQLHAVYTRARDERWPLLSNAAAFPRLPAAPRGPGNPEHAARSAPHVLSGHEPQGATQPYAVLLRRREGGLAGAFLSLLRSAGLCLGEAMGAPLRAAEHRRPGRQRERGGRPRAWLSARREVLK